MSQISFFDQMEKECIPGLNYIPEYITADQENELIKLVEHGHWSFELKRRVQHYGYKYNYQLKNINVNEDLGPMPSWLEKYCNQLLHEGIFDDKPNQVIINEYLPGQGISAHIDCPISFGNTICSLSLGSPCVMDFSGIAKRIALLKPRGLLILKDSARYNWKHSIPSRKKDLYNGQVMNRGRRISITFRYVLDRGFTK